MSTPQNAATPEAVGEQLRRILASKRFLQSPSLTRLLRHTVEQTLQGHAGGLKEYSLGRDVFDRGEEFDPRIDPIVRVQAAKLRHRLEQYYQGEGAGDSILVEIPRGAYVPVFSVLQRRATAPSPGSRPRIALLVCLGAAGIAVAALVWWLLRSTPQAQVRELVRFTSHIGANAWPALSRDGKLLVYASDQGAQDLNLWVQPVAGGQPVRLTRHPAADITPDFSPDGTEIVFRSQRDGGGIYLVSVLGGEERRIADHGWRPRFSPDGRWIAYQGASQRPSGDLYVVPAAGGGRRMVPIGPDLDLWGTPIWTPDGRFLLFAALAGGQLDWYVVPPSGGSPVPTGFGAALRKALQSPPPVDVPPGDWVGDSVVFSLPLEDSATIWRIPFASGVWKVNGPPQQITFGTAFESSPRAAAFGRLAFSSEKPLTQLWSLAEGAEPRQLTDDSSLSAGSFRAIPRFSAAAGWLAFTSRRTGNRDVWVRRLETGKEYPVGSSPLPEDQPLLAPGGLVVAFRVHDGPRQHIRWASPETRVPSGTCPDCGVPESWTPDGKHLLHRLGGALSVLNVGTGASVKLLDDPAFPIKQGAFSPDGGWLLLCTADTPGTPSRVFVAPYRECRLAERPLWILAAGDPTIESVHWSADGGALLYFSYRDDHRCLWSQPLDPLTRRPAGSPRAVRHFHQTRLRPWNTLLAAVPGRIIISLTDASSEIWTARLFLRP